MKDPELLTEMPLVLSDELFDDIIGGYLDGFRRFAALREAVRLSLFAHTHRPVTIDELTERIGCDPVMLRMLCDCLVSMGHLLDKDGLYVNSEATSLYLDPRSPRYQGTVLSNMSREFIDFLRKMPVYRCFDGEVISCEEQVVKPEPEIYRRLLDRYSLDPAETLFIDDRPVNLEAARTFGISTFLFRHREAQRSCDELRKMLL